VLSALLLTQGHENNKYQSCILKEGGRAIRISQSLTKLLRILERKARVHAGAKESNH